jgi:hypothetical protein
MGSDSIDFLQRERSVLVLEKSIESDPIRNSGAIAQLGEHLLCKQGVVGSIPTGSTNSARHLRVQNKVSCLPRSFLLVSDRTSVQATLLFFKNLESCQRRKIRFIVIESDLQSDQIVMI